MVFFVFLDCGRGGRRMFVGISFHSFLQKWEIDGLQNVGATRGVEEFADLRR